MHLASGLKQTRDGVSCSHSEALSPAPLRPSVYRTRTSHALSAIIEPHCAEMESRPPMADQRLVLRECVHGTDLRRSARRYAGAGLACRGGGIAVGHRYRVPQCLVERQIYGSLDRPIPEFAEKGDASGAAQHPSDCVGIRVVSPCDGRTPRRSPQCGLDADPLTVMKCFTASHAPPPNPLGALVSYDCRFCAPAPHSTAVGEARRWTECRA